ncbi:MAG: hypothetical protein Kow00108_11300 [Calditrichia bacterium]
MIFSYHKKKREVKMLKTTDFKSHSIMEREDIEAWIEEHPEILGEVDEQGNTLKIIAKEFSSFDQTNERLDLLAIDREGNLVVIELKRDDSGRNAGLQAIKYAAYCSTMTLDDVVKIYLNYQQTKGNSMTPEQARSEILDFITNEEFEEFSDRTRIILVSREYQPEVTASVMWLRNFGVDIKCVKITPHEMDKDILAIESNVLIPVPEAEDFMIKVARKEKSKDRKSERELEYIQFYKELISELDSEVDFNLDLKSPKGKNYYQIPTGKKYIHFEWAFHGRGRRSSFGVELHFENPKKEKNFEIFKTLATDEIRKHLENITGEKVIYDKNWGSNWCRIYIENNEYEMSEELKQ